MQTSPLGQRSSERTSDGAVAAIRDQTRDIHRRLEVELGVMSPDLDLARYRSLLLGLAAVHQALQREIGAQLSRASIGAASVALGLETRDRVRLIRRDLHALGVDLPVATGFRLTSVPGALGALYVCEGSRLGGEFIADHVRSVLGDNAPVEFFTSPADEVAHLWSTCCRVIDEMLVTTAAIAEASAVAVSVFGHFGEVLR